MDFFFEKETPEAKQERFYLQLATDWQCFPEPEKKEGERGIEFAGRRWEHCNFLDVVRARLALVSDIAIAEDESRQIVNPPSLKGNYEEVLGEEYIRFVSSYAELPDDEKSSPDNADQYRDVVMRSIPQFTTFLEGRFQSLVARAKEAERDLAALTEIENEMRYMQSFQPWGFSIGEKDKEYFWQIIKRLQDKRTQPPDGAVVAPHQQALDIMFDIKELFYGVEEQINRLSPIRRRRAAEAAAEKSRQVPMCAGPSTPEAPEEDPDLTR